ncbi:MAG: hypothetical protein ACLQME_21195 [Alphaproteobacteria bacterium]
MADETKTSQINLRLQPALKRAAEAAAVNDHRSLTSLIEKLLADYVRTEPTLEDWHRSAYARFVELLQLKKVADGLRFGYSAHSYAVRTSAGEQLAPHELTNILRATYAALGSMISSPNLFYPYTREELLPYFTSDDRLERGKTSEILEFFGPPQIMSQVDFWRISPTGLVSDIRSHFEDREDFLKRGLEPGKWFWPFFLTRRLAEVVIHSYVFSQRFASAESVEFRCEWSGLLERVISDPEPMVHWLPGKIARVDHRVTIGEWPAKSLANEWPEIVSALGGPVMRLFDSTFDYSPDFVRQQFPRFKRG